MPDEELRGRLARLWRGERLILSRAQFEAAFPDASSENERRERASRLAGYCHCTVHFLSGDTLYAVFQRGPDPSQP